MRHPPDDTEQPRLPWPDEARLIRRGTLTVAHCADGRALLWLSTGTRGGAWLELLPAERRWLSETLERTA